MPVRSERNAAAAAVPVCLLGEGCGWWRRPAHAVSSTASCPAIRIPPSFLFDRVQQLPAGLLATAAGLGGNPAALMHPGMPFALVAAALTYRRANPKERLGNYGVVLRLAA